MLRLRVLAARRRYCLILDLRAFVCVKQAAILHSLVPTEAPYLRMLENYEPPADAEPL